MPRFHIDTDTQDAAFEIEQTLTASREKRPSNHRSSDSEAAVYLRQFQSSWRHPSRPNTSRIPSLSHTPSSSTSISLSSSDYQYEPPIGSSDSRRESSVFASNTDLVTPIAYGPTTPASLETIAATRKNDGCEKWSLKSGPAATQISMGVPEPDLSPYEEKPMPSSGQGVSGSIRQLFNFDAMRQDHLGM
ncbi:MAG: hypothetical protein M1828_002872 [Chrysothrix sp. TS-e1954]|nr:MAG: hypothetical protein M1828_002872 [Chrysothrix sp. TS-e1954]